MRTRVVKHLEDLADLREQWNRLAEPFGTPLLNFEWFESCAAASMPPGRLHVVLVFSDRDLIAVAPLIYCCTSLVPTLRILGNPYCKLYEPTSFIYRDEAALRHLIDAIVSFSLPLNLEKFLSNSPVIPTISGKTQRWFHLPPRRDASLFVPIQGAWSHYESSLSKSFRETLRRKTRKAHKIGPIGFEHIAPTPDKYPDYLEKFMRLENSGWKARNGTAVSQNPFQRRFFSEYGMRMAANGHTRIALMTIGDEIAAMKILVQFANRLWELKTSYDDKYKNLSPGILLTHDTLRYAFESGLQQLEFLGSEESWERHWTDHAREYQKFRLFPASITGLAALGETALRWTINRLLK